MIDPGATVWSILWMAATCAADATYVVVATDAIRTRPDADSPPPAPFVADLAPWVTAELGPGDGDWVALHTAAQDVGCLPTLQAPAVRLRLYAPRTALAPVLAEPLTVWDGDTEVRLEAGVALIDGAIHGRSWSIEGLEVGAEAWRPSYTPTAAEPRASFAGLPEGAELSGTSWRLETTGALAASPEGDAEVVARDRCLRARGRASQGLEPMPTGPVGASRSWWELPEGNTPLHRLAVQLEAGQSLTWPDGLEAGIVTVAAPVEANAWMHRADGDRTCVGWPLLGMDAAVVCVPSALLDDDLRPWWFPPRTLLLERTVPKRFTLRDDAGLEPGMYVCGAAFASTPDHRPAGKVLVWGCPEVLADATRATLSRARVYGGVLSTGEKVGALVTLPVPFSVQPKHPASTRFEVRGLPQ